jgi:subtilisin family serine protease
MLRGMFTRSARRSRTPFVAAAAAVALAGAVATVGGADAAPASPTTPKTFRHAAVAKNSASDGLPRILTDGATGLPQGVPTHGRYAFLLRLGTNSTLATYRQLALRGKTVAASAAKSQYTEIKAAQADVVDALPSGTHVLYKMHSVLAGVAVVTDVRNYAALQRISGVQAVYPVTPKTVSNAYAVPLVGAPAAWTAHSNRGQSSTIAVIDTGIDYTHANFGGPGTVAAYDAALASDTADPTYPDPTKIIGGYDFVGDDYDPESSTPADTIPIPDANPLDCSGHGSHVAGTAAGYGVTSGGATYPGPYDNTTPFSGLRIGPGMAPKAKLLVYKVFGCDGSTDVIGEAIDRAADPDNNPATDDAADVINMSLGSDYGSPQDADSVASNQASRLGITVVVASGNGGDRYDNGGSPGNAVRTIAVANSVDAQSYLDSVHVTAPIGIAGDYRAERSIDYDWSHDADLAGDVVHLTQNGNTDACDTVTQNLTGKIAFVEWTDNDAVRRCGSAVRADNLEAAHAIGFIFADDANTFTAGIAGNDSIPGVLVTKAAGDTIRAQLGTGVTVNGTAVATFKPINTALNDKLNSSSSRGIRGAGNVKPDVTAVGTSVFSTAMGTGSGGVSFDGTSMATPMVAGLAALVHTAHAGWTPEQVKADIMNTAGQDLFTGNAHSGARYAPNRVGAGRVRAVPALNNRVLAYVQDNPGAVSVSFGPVAITGATTLTKTVKVVNKSGAAASFTLAYHAITSVPGVSYQVSPSSLTIAAGVTKTFTVKLVVTNAAALTKTRDATVARTIDLGGPQPVGREFVADASGRVALTPAGSYTGPALRVPVYSAPRPASTMTQPSTAVLPGSGVQFGSLPLSGHGVNQGSGATKVRSFVSGFELQATSGLAPSCTSPGAQRCVHYADERAADLKYVGTTSDYPLIKSLGDPTPFADAQAYFSITAQKPWRTAAGLQEFDVLIDTNNNNVPDAVMYNTRLGEDDIFLSELVSITGTTACLRDDELINDRFGSTDTALFDSDTMVLPLWVARLGAISDGDCGSGPAALPALPGFSSSHTRVRYGVVTLGATGVVDSIGVNLVSGNLSATHLTTDLTHPGVELYNQSILNAPTVGLLLNSDQPGTSLTVRRDVAQYNADNGKGALLVHFHNRVGAKAKVVTLKTKPRVTTKLADATITLHQSMTATVTVANTAGHTPTGKVTLRRSTGSAIKSGSLVNGKITFTWTPGSRGTFQVYATYAGNAVYASGRSPAVSYKVS